MPSVYKVLGQASPAAGNAETALYTVPAGGQAVVSTLALLGPSAAGTTFRLRIAVANAASSTKQYLLYDLPVGTAEPRLFTIGITLGAGDVVYCAAAAANGVVQLFGQEITP